MKSDSELMHLYTNNTGKKSFQWEIWPECNNLCSFCYLGLTNRKIDNFERHLTSLEDLERSIDTLDFSVYNNVSLIGGEFFQGQLNDVRLHDKFMKIMNKLADLYVQEKIGSIWLTVTLTIGDQKHLYEVLDIFEKKQAFPKKEWGASGLWLCTSWDTVGRFHTPSHLNNWDFQMKKIKKEYPWIKFNTTIILQEAFILDYINDKWSPKKFMEEYNTSLFYKQPGVGILSNEEYNAMGETADERQMEAKKYINKKLGYAFFPRRSLFLTFLRKYVQEDTDTYDRLFNIKYRADCLFRNFNEVNASIKYERFKNDDFEAKNIAINTCGHPFEYACYIDNNKCAICDRNMIRDNII